MGYNRKIVVAAALGFALRLVGFVVASAAESNQALNAIQYGVPVFVAAICIWFLLNRKRASEIFKLPTYMRPQRKAVL